MVRLLSACVLTALLLAHPGSVTAQQNQSRPLVLAHYMPWFSANPAHSRWGWHWTMNKFDPKKHITGVREIASHFHPTIGPYDSGDPHVIEYHLLLMKLAGIDGVVVDWYGLEDLHDYAMLHRNTERLVEQCERLQMQFLICYEDQTIPALVKAGRIAKDASVAHAQNEIRWLGNNWFSNKNYVRVDDRPALLSFGHEGLSDLQWSECLRGIETKVAYFSQHKVRDAAIGGFDWPMPKKGIAASQKFLHQSRRWKHRIPVAFPRFVDIYAEAGVHESWGRIEDADGLTLKQTLNLALDANTRIIQIATWNDWGEGTQIEPSHEHGLRDLELIRDATAGAGLQPAISELGAIRTQVTSKADLTLPERILALRRGSDDQQAVTGIVTALVNGNLTQANQKIETLESSN